MKYIKDLYHNKGKLYTIISILIIVPIGFYSKFYSGVAKNWVNNSLGGVFYEIFWCLLFFLFANKKNPRLIALYVFICTCFLEILQLSKSSILQFIRTYYIGQVIIGTTFVWSDFIYYVLGVTLGLYLIKFIISKA